MYEPWDSHVQNQQEGISSQVTLWKDESSAALALNIPNALVISVSGNLEHRHFVEVCAFAGRKWRAAQERLILDFTKMKGAEASGIRYVASQLHATANQSGGTVFFVKIPPMAKAYLDKTWGSEHIHFVHSLKLALSAATAAGQGPGLKPGTPSKAKKKIRRRRRSGSPRIIRGFSTNSGGRSW